MSKKVSELEELLKLLGADSVEDVQLCFTDTCGEYGRSATLEGINAGLSGNNRYSKYYYQNIVILNNNNKPIIIQYHPENMNENNEWSYNEIFKINNVSFIYSNTTSVDTPCILLTEDLLKLLDNKSTVYCNLNCD